LIKKQGYGAAFPSIRTGLVRELPTNCPFIGVQNRQRMSIIVIDNNDKSVPLKLMGLDKGLRKMVVTVAANSIESPAAVLAAQSRRVPVPIAVSAVRIRIPRRKL